MHNAARLTPGVFQALFDQYLPAARIERLFDCFGPLRRRPPKLNAPQLIMGLVFHFLAGAGKLAAHIKELTDIDITDSALSQRRALLPFEIFKRLMDEALSVKATPELHPEAFYKGLRLCGLDGSRLAIANTPRVKASMSKARSRRFKAAFAQIGVAVMVELGLRNPIGASIGTRDESEMVLAKPLVEKLPAQSLLIEDRYYGVPKELLRFREVHTSGERHFLVRVRRNIKSRLLQLHPDGSALVEIRCGKQTMLVREIQGLVGRGSGKPSPVRLWTSLLDWKEYPAGELLRTYGQRWEEEGFYRELKIDLRSAELVQSHTPETAAQEIAAYLLGYAMVTDQRMKAAVKGEVAVLRISFRKTLEVVRNVWRTLELMSDMLSKGQVRTVVSRALEQIAAQANPPRRQRSCPRAVRQPVTSWPRLKRNTYKKGELEFTILPMAS